MLRAAAGATTPFRPASASPEVARLIDYLTAGAGSGEPSPSLWMLGSVGPLLHDGEPRYRLLEPIGHGSTSTVYQASDRLLATDSSDALVAVKLSRCDTPGDAERLLTEARSARRVEHRNVLRVLDCGVSGDGRVYTVLELVDGPTLDAYIAKSPRPRRELVHLLIQAASGLEAIHAAGLVHCDLKPANLLIGPDGTLKIADFGAAATQTRKAPLSDASTPDARGTLAFMAPEQFRLERGALTPSSDIFSLGATLFWALTGQAVAGGCAAEAVANLCTDGGIRPHDLDRRLRAAGVDADLRAITTRALAPIPTDRYGSAGVLASDLAAWSDRRPVEWMRPGPLKRARLAARRHPLAAVTVCLALLGAATAAVALADARRLAAEAEAREVELLLVKAKRESEGLWRKRSLESLMNLMSGFRSAKEHGLAAEVLTSLWVLEWAHGPVLLQNPAALGEIWATRIDVLEHVRDEARRAGGADSIGARLAEPSLALWLIRDGRPAEASVILDEAIPYWERHAPAGDPWLHELHTLRAAARVGVLRQTATERSLSPAEADEVAAHTKRLADELCACDAASRTGPLPLLLRNILTAQPTDAE